MIFRLSFFVAASVAAAAAVSRINTDSSRKRNSSDIKDSEKDGSSFRQIEAKEEEKLADEISDEKAHQEEEVKMVTRKIIRQSYEVDIPKELLRNLEEELEERKLITDGKLLELYGLEEHQSYVAQLRGNLEEKMTMIDMLNEAIDSLQDEVKNLQEEMRQAVMTNEQLQTAKKTVEKLQMKMDLNTSNMKRQLLLLEQQVSRFLCSKDITINDDVIEKKLKAARKVGLEFMEMQRMNKELELEKRELTVKLVDAQARIKALSNMTEDKILAKIEKEITILRHNNEGLSKEVERLQRNRFNMVEELVYQRWLNACLRFETQNYQTPPRKTSISDQKAKRIVLDPGGFDIISSQTSSTESNENDSCSTTDSSSNSWRSDTQKSGLMHSIKNMGRSKDDSSAAASPDNSPRSLLLGRTGQIRRHSTSVIPSTPSVPSTKGENSSTITPFWKKMVHQSVDESQNTPTFPRIRRVSFCDSVETCVPTIQDAGNPVEEMTHDQKVCKNKSDQSLAQADYPIDSSTKNVNSDSIDDQVGRRIGTAETEKLQSMISSDLAGESKDETSIVNHTTAALPLFLFMFLVYFLLLTTGILLNLKHFM